MAEKVQQKSPPAQLANGLCVLLFLNLPSEGYTSQAYCDLHVLNVVATTRIHNLNTCRSVEKRRRDVSHRAELVISKEY